MPRKSETLLCGDDSTISPTFGEFKHSDFGGDPDEADIHIVRLYRKRFSNVKFNMRTLVVEYDQPDPAS